MAGPVPPPADDDVGLRALGTFIRDQRRQTRLSMRKLAELAGVSNPYLSQIERGMRKPSAEILRQIARALEMASSKDLVLLAGKGHETYQIIGQEKRSFDERAVVANLLRRFWADTA